MSFTLPQLVSHLDNKDIPLPGVKRHYEMMSTYKIYKKAVPENYREASVLCLFFPSEEGEIHFTLIKRVSNVPDDPHSGQISFPGGSREPDESIEDTAIRETYEEIGVHREDIKISRKLTDLYIPVSNFLVHPYIGYLDYEPVINPQLSEVHSVLFITLKDLLNHSLLVTGNVEARGRTFENVKYFDFEGEVVWGATAMMLNEIKHLLLA